MATNTLVKYSFRAGIYQKGYSLFELLTTLGITAFLLLIALPNLKVIISKNALENRVELLLLSIKTAKAAAIKPDKNIIICRKEQQFSRCAGDSLQGKKDWKFGWLVFSDSNQDRIYQENEKLINKVSMNANSCSITWNRGDSLGFKQFGLLKGSRAGSFYFSCSKQTTQLVINWVGRIRRKN